MRSRTWSISWRSTWYPEALRVVYLRAGHGFDS